ncbi:murein L,D-transpeptidase catalytic domain family protein [Luteimonas sp. MC1572]|nr:murein L,D-transpeptidase catalytic domain family protein [Luteimonas sp. MC1572]QQO03491.1 murein L,D-transpeptidase catalytic domain family protein [Luteimonas sp. MC1572]
MPNLSCRHLHPPPARLPGMLLALLLAAAPLAHAQDLLARLSAAAPGLDRKVLALALEARDCARAAGVAGSGAERLAVIDYTLPSTEKRLWIFDLDRGALLHAEHVAHGRGSGDNMATRFSNVEGSYQSSLGLFATAETYMGENGYSLRMDGLEPGINDAARERLLVMHGADYVDPAQARRQGRLGRSWGCPAVRAGVARAVIDDLRDGQLVFAYARDASWLNGSRFLHCPRAERKARAAR